MTLTILRERTTDAFVVHLIGDLDPGRAGAVAQVITSAPESLVVVDVSDLSSLHDDGLRALVGAGDQITGQGKTLRVVGAHGSVWTAIRSSSLERYVGLSDFERPVSS
jgi:anti-anti-sigma factor